MEKDIRPYLQLVNIFTIFFGVFVTLRTNAVTVWKINKQL